MELRLDVTGVDELARRCTAAADEDLHDVHQDVADIVEQAAEANATSRQMARAVRSNRVRATANGTEIDIGGSGGDDAWAIGAQWGSTAFHQFPAKTPDGYTVGPAITDHLEGISDEYADAYLKHF